MYSDLFYFVINCSHWNIFYLTLGFYFTCWGHYIFIFYGIWELCICPKNVSMPVNDWMQIQCSAFSLWHSVTVFTEWRFTFKAFFFCLCFGVFFLGKASNTLLLGFQVNPVLLHSTFFFLYLLGFFDFQGITRMKCVYKTMVHHKTYHICLKILLAWKY